MIREIYFYIPILIKNLSFIIPKSIFGNITIEGSKTLEFTQKDYGGAPACPKFIVNTGMSMRFINPYMGIDKIVSLYTGKTNQFEEFLFYGPSVKIVFSLPTTPSTAAPI